MKGGWAGVLFREMDRDGGVRLMPRRQVELCVVHRKLQQHNPLP